MISPASSALIQRHPPLQGARVSVSLITYNQARYIGRAIESVLSQITPFPVELVISDDASTDGTGDICRAYEARHPDKIRLLSREGNVGLVPNYLGTFQSCAGQYVALLEGDDFWTDPHKLQKQVAFMDAHPEYVICCHNVVLVDENDEGDKVLLHDVPEVSTVRDLCRGDYVATASCLLRNGVLETLPPWIYGMYACDWPLDILHAEHGPIRYFPEAMAAYRVHQGGMWSCHTEESKLQLTLDAIDVMNQALGHRYARSFLYAQQGVRNRLVELQEERTRHQATYLELLQRHEALSAQHQELLLKHAQRGEALRSAKMACQEWKAREKAARRSLAQLKARLEGAWYKRAMQRWKQKLRKPATAPLPAPDLRECAPAPSSVTVPASQPKPDLVILDDFFPHPLSQFRFQEFTSLLDAFPNAQVRTTGASLPSVKENRDVEAVIAETASRHPELNGRVLRHDPGQPLQARSAYVLFANNIFHFLPEIEAAGIPFAFTLYPGGGFQLYDRRVESSLRRVFASPWFRKVVVTQNITRDYLLETNLCPQDKVVFIPGVVTPEASLSSRLDRSWFGSGRDELRVCFVAHKYTPDGRDKGYDVFIAAARQLARESDRIQFHVAGGFALTDLDVSGLEGRIQFHGPLTGADLPNFYRGMDLIVSPNLPFQLLPGAFDGFPTGCCTDAALCGAVMLCTDLLGLNEVFTDGEEILIIPHDASRIAGQILQLLEDPARLQRIARAGRAKTLQAYSLEKQVHPRVDLLRDLMQSGSADAPAPAKVRAEALVPSLL